MNILVIAAGAGIKYSMTNKINVNNETIKVIKRPKLAQTFPHLQFLLFDSFKLATLAVGADGKMELNGGGGSGKKDPI